MVHKCKRRKEATENPTETPLPYGMKARSVELRTTKTNPQDTGENPLQLEKRNTK